MTRPIDARLVATGRLVAESPLHVGGMSDDLETDMPLTRDGRGRLYIPGTSLAGPLRAWMEDCFGDYESLLEVLWGHQPSPRAERPAPRHGADPKAEDTGSASRILVEDAEVRLPPGLDEEIWDGVGIDRESGTASRDIKFDRAVLPVGSEIRLRMLLELPRDDRDADSARAMLGHLLAALARAEIGLGAAGNRGLGRVRLTLDELGEEDWSCREGVLAILRGDGRGALTLPGLQGATTDCLPRPPERLLVRIHWHPDGPLMTKAGHDGIAVDMLPMVSATADGLLAPVLPGSGTKGALRSQAERIVRTLLDISLPDETVRGRNRHLEQLKVPLVENLFGTAKSADTESQDGKPDRWQPGRGVLSVATTFAEGARAAAGHWRAIADAAPDPDQGVPDPAERPLCKALADAGLGADSSAGSAVPRLEQAFHVAVDRWTGGAAEKLLFSGIEPFAIPWAPIELTLETGRLPPGLREPALALLLLVLRDLSEGRVTLGVGANRGYGSLVVERLELAVAKGRDEAGSLAWLDGLVLDAPLDLTALDAARMGEVQQAWHTWIIDQGGRHD